MPLRPAKVADRDVDALRELAAAKINLFLHIEGRRTDGMHELDSLVVFGDIGDMLMVVPADHLALSVDGPFAESVPADAGNLVQQAAEALRGLTGVRLGARITLTKNLPVAAGIGGGSADAAAALRALCRLWKQTPEPDALRRLALSLGADVPVCLSGLPQSVGGIGEQTRFCENLPKVSLVLVNPGVPVATADVFRRYDEEATRRPLGRQRSEPITWAPPHEFDGFLAALGHRRNDLQACASAAAPDIAAVLAELGAIADCCLARMSGSGATCWGLFRSQEQAQAAAATLARKRPNWWVRATALRHVSG